MLTTTIVFPVCRAFVPAVRAFAVAIAALTALPATAGPYSGALGTCLSDNTTGRERKELARWIFVAMSAHPEMADLSTVTSENRDQIYQSMGTLITRLLAENCVNETRAAVQNEGSQSLETAFASLGAMAMKELMTNQDVKNSISGFEKFLDRKKLQSVLSGK